MMLKFKEVQNESGQVEKIQTQHTGKFLLAIPELNKGSAFTLSERQKFKLVGKLPVHVETLEQQVARYYAQFKAIETDLAKNNFLNKLKQHNNTAFYRLAMQHLEEMLPIVYTPTIGDAVQKYSFQFDLPRGLTLAYPNQDRLDEVMEAISFPDVDLIIVTDGEGVLGIGDWGVGGIDICVGKLMVYTLCAGVNPRRVLPIQIDVGTNNETLLNDPMYLGWRHKRITGSDYDAFIDKAVAAITKKFPNVYLHWEDFGRDNARRNLNRFRDKMCTFNDDMQGTGATATACVMSAVKSLGQSIKDQRVVFFGAGTAGVGIADQLAKAMVMAGATESEARANIWLIDRNGLLVDDMDDLAFFQKPYAKPRRICSDWSVESQVNITLAEAVLHVRPTVLIGCSAVTGAFTESIIKSMTQFVEHPIVFPLSNPTTKAEAKPADIIRWTDAKAIIATGSPFAPVEYAGKKIPISQCNNAYVFPGLGLGVLAAKARRVTDAMISAVSNALSDSSPVLGDSGAPLLPPLDDIHAVSKRMAIAVAEQAIADGVAGIPRETDLLARVDAIFWQPEYLPYELVEKA